MIYMDGSAAAQPRQPAPALANVAAVDLCAKQLHAALTSLASDRFCGRLVHRVTKWDSLRNWGLTTYGVSETLRIARFS